jgi:hypothetical protein
VTPPAAPTGLTASATAFNTNTAQVALSWTASTGAVSYDVYRSISANGEGGTPLATGVTGTTFTDSTAVFGTTYFYKVSAVNTGGQSGLSNEASATPLFLAHVHFTAQSGGDTVANYLSDVGLAYGSRVNGLSFGWNQDNTANGRDRDATNSPDELHDGLAHLQKPNNPNAWWGLAVPNGTYSVHLISGDPSNIDSVYKLNVGGTRSGTTISGGVLAINGTPTASTHWFENTVTVTVTGGVLYVSNAAGSSNNKIDEIDVHEVLTSAGFAAGVAPYGPGLQLNGSASKHGAVLQLTNGGTNEAASAFTARPVDVAKFTNSFDFQLLNPNANGITFTLQGLAATALGSPGAGLGYGTIARSVAVTFDLLNSQGKSSSSTGLYLNGASPTNVGSVDLAPSGIDLHSGHVFNVAMSYDGVTLTVTIKDKLTKATATQRYKVDIVKAVGGSKAFVGFTGGTGGMTATENILDWDFTPQP